jgi:hypothetical protein
MHTGTEGYRHVGRYLRGCPLSEEFADRALRADNITIYPTPSDNLVGAVDWSAKGITSSVVTEGNKISRQCSFEPRSLVLVHKLLEGPHDPPLAVATKPTVGRGIQGSDRIREARPDSLFGNAQTRPQYGIAVGHRVMMPDPALAPSVDRPSRLPARRSLWTQERTIARSDQPIAQGSDCRRTARSRCAMPTGGAPDMTDRDRHLPTGAAGRLWGADHRTAGSACRRFA